MNQRGAVTATLAIIVVIMIGVGVVCLVPLANTAKKVDNASQVALQAALTDFANEACNKNSVNEVDFDKLIQKITGPNTYEYGLQVYVLGESDGKETSQAVSDKVGDKYTIYYISQIEEIWKKNNGKFPIEEGTQVYVYAKNTNTTMSTQLTSPTSSDISNIIAEATATCTK